MKKFLILTALLFLIPLSSFAIQDDYDIWFRQGDSTTDFPYFGSVHITDTTPSGWLYEGLTVDGEIILGGASNHSTQFAFRALDPFTGEANHFVIGWRIGDQNFVAFDFVEGIWGSGYWE